MLSSKKLRLRLLGEKWREDSLIRNGLPAGEFLRHVVSPCYGYDAIGVPVTFLRDRCNIQVTLIEEPYQIVRSPLHAHVMLLNLLRLADYYSIFHYKVDFAQGLAIIQRTCGHRDDVGE
jgi:hypothetical protein